MFLIEIARARLSAADGAASRRSGRRSDMIFFLVMHDEPLVWMLRSASSRWISPGGNRCVPAWSLAHNTPLRMKNQHSTDRQFRTRTLPHLLISNEAGTVPVEYRCRSAMVSCIVWCNLYFSSGTGPQCFFVRPYAGAVGLGQIHYAAIPFDLNKGPRFFIPRGDQIIEHHDRYHEENGPVIGQIVRQKYSSPHE